MKIQIVYEDADIIVCVKPHAVPTQSDKTHDEDMVSFLKNYIFEKYEMNSEPELYVVHRLDRPVGGIMVFARNKDTASNLSKQIQEGKFEKNYQAVLTGELSQESGTLVNYLLKDAKTNLSKVVTQNTEGAKKAELRYEVLDVVETEEGVFSYIMIELITGRHHQIRVQLAEQKAGIWGDTKYNPLFTNTKGTYKQIGLFATRIAFIHPSTGKKLVFKTEPNGEAFDLIEAEDF